VRTYLDCYPCFLNQALRAARIATDDEAKIKRVLDEVGMMLKEIPLDSTPPESGRLIYRKISEITENIDPYRKIKKESTEKALSLYPYLKSRVVASNDRLLMAIRIAIAGNVIDFGANWGFDWDTEVADTLEKEFALFDYDKFREKLDTAQKIVYLGDNAGECVFDKILIEEMKKPVVYVVRGAPIINDATRADAVQAGIDKVATIVSSGTDAPGTILDTCSTEFKALFHNSDFIISKGQGNYEALSHTSASRLIFFLLKVKCRVLARNIGVEEGGIVIQAGRDR